MAKGVDFPEANLTLGAPSPYEATTVYGLRVCRYADLDGRPNVLSKWELTPEEIEEIARTGVVWLNLQGVTHAPVWVSGADPFRRD